MFKINFLHVLSFILLSACSTTSIIPSNSAAQIDREPASLSSMTNSCIGIISNFFSPKVNHSIEVSSAEVTNTTSSKVLNNPTTNHTAARSNFKNVVSTSESTAAPTLKTASKIPHISEYIKSSKINKKLRAGQLTKEDQEFINGLQKELKEMPQYQGRATRTASFDFDFEAIYKPGTIVEEVTFTSASKGAGAALMGDTIFYQVIFEIESKTARDISKINPIEAEVVFLPGTKFKVKSIDGGMQFNDITLDEIHMCRQDHLDLETDCPIYEEAVSTLKNYSKYFKGEEKLRMFTESAIGDTYPDNEFYEEDITKIEDLILKGYDPIIKIKLIEI